jgi:hypothetical protein
MIDPTTGVAVVFHMQLAPPAGLDRDVAEYAAKLETALYAGLQVSGDGQHS